MRMTAVRWFSAVAVLAAAGAVPVLAQGPPPGRRGGGMMMGPPLQLSSSAFQDLSTYPAQYSCAPNGQMDVAHMTSPPLSWKNPPAGTKSFVLLLHDPDAHAGKSVDDITHWIIFNIPGDSTSLPEGVKADAPASVGVQGMNIAHQPAFFGPCAPPGPPHHYTFELYALDTTLDLQKGASRDDIMKAMNGHVLGGTVMIGMFARKPGGQMGGPPPQH
ncbi:MAG: YbhB/YbcL family Raf kinase inhibitor-like protein [Candidatus Acidiferrales bacterium]